MIPKNSSKYAPWLSKAVGLKVGMQVKILTEAVEKTLPKGVVPFLMDVMYEDKVYALSLNNTSYYEIAKKFGEDTASWIDLTIQYEGLKDIKSPKGTVRGHIWHGVEEVIDLDKDTTPF